MKSVDGQDGLLVIDLGDDFGAERWFAEIDAPGGVVRTVKDCPLKAAAAVLASAALAWKRKEDDRK